MRKFICFACLILVSAGLLCWVIWEYPRDARFAELLARGILPFFTLGAVLLALFGDYLRELVDPVRVRIELPERGNTIFDEWTIDGTPHDVYCHHLVVRNLTPHKPIKDCRVWLEKFYIQNLNGEWKEETTFAVPRLMRWAPFEYSEDRRTFCTYQVFDLGRTIGNDKGFEVSVNPAQGGTFNRRFAVGKRIRFSLYVTANNYQGHDQFYFEVEVPQSTKGTPVTPSTVKTATP